MKIELESYDVAIIVSGNLAKLREFHGLNQTQIAEKIKTSQAGYCLSENGSRELNYLNLYSMAVEFGMDLNSLFGLSDERFNPLARIKHRDNLAKVMRRRSSTRGKK